MSVDYTPGSEVAWEDLADELRDAELAFCIQALLKFMHEPGHVLIANHPDVDVTIVAATGEARSALDEFLKTVPPKGEA